MSLPVFRLRWVEAGESDALEDHKNTVYVARQYYEVTSYFKLQQLIWDRQRGSLWVDVPIEWKP